MNDNEYMKSRLVIALQVLSWFMIIYAIYANDILLLLIFISAFIVGVIQGFIKNPNFPKPPKMTVKRYIAGLIVTIIGAHVLNIIINYFWN